MIRVKRQLGMTLIELALGLASLSVLGLAIGSVMAAAGSAWQTRDHFTDQVQTVRTTATKVAEWVRHSQRIVSLAGDDRYVDIVLWADDSSDVGNVNIREIKVITYDKQQHTLILYQANPSLMTVLQPAVVGSQNFGPTFRSNKNVTGYLLADGVTGFNAVVTNGIQGGLSYRYLHMTMRVASPAGVPDQTIMVAAAVRAPNTTVDFLGETEVDESNEPGDPIADAGGISIGLGVEILGINVNTAVTVVPNQAFASVVVGTTPGSGAPAPGSGGNAPGQNS